MFGTLQGLEASLGIAGCDEKNRWDFEFHSSQDIS
jgi:hypothetical protein